MIKIAPKPLRITLGSDPELLLKNVVTNKVVSALRVLGETKEQPKVVQYEDKKITIYLGQTKEHPIDLGDGVRAYSDSTLIESAFPEVPSSELLVQRLRSVFQKMKRRIGKNYTLLPQASHVFDKDELDHPLAWLIGCSPTINVWDKRINEPKPFTDGLRSSSFHVHVWSADYKKDPDGPLMTVPTKEKMVKLLDVYLGVASVLFDRDPTALARRRLYGRSSECRFTPGGIEYRCLGSYSLRSQELVHLVTDLVDHTVSRFNDGTGDDALRLIKEADIRGAIDKCDAVLANKVLVQSEMPAALMKRIKADYKIAPSLEEAWALEA